LVLQGGPDLVVELRSPSNTRPEEKRKRPQYFDNGTLIVWDVDPAFGLTGYLLSLIQSVS
jgi:Uma2 family endonuclease